MSDELENRNPDGSKPLFWATSAFYVLIAFEFFYMASPFAAYFYSVYGPGMDWLQALPVADWTLWFFLPHLVEDTKSVVIDSLEVIGVGLFFGGMATFAVGAFQVYRAKIFDTGAVVGGTYRHIRHPQYSALIIASLGMLLIWPRFLVLFSTAFVILAYILLARAEEGQCRRRFSGYADYMANTGMFVPSLSSSWKPTDRAAKLGGNWQVFCLFIFGVGLSLLAAFGIRSAAMASLYTVDTEAGVFLSVAEIGEDDLKALTEIVLADDEAIAAIAQANAQGRVLAYVLPTQMYVSEIPMVLPDGETFGHSVPRSADPFLWKVVLTRAEFGAGSDGGNIIAEAVNKTPLIEVHIDLSSHEIDRRIPPPMDEFYGGRQVPIF